MSWRQFVFSPEGFVQVGLLSAAGRADCTPVLSIGAISAQDAAVALRRLSGDCAGVGFAVSVPSLDEATRSLLAPVIGRGLAGVVLTDVSCDTLADSVAWCEKAAIEPLVEICTLPEALRAVECGARGLFAKGSESGGRVAEETTFILLQRILPKVRIPVYARGGIGLHTSAACLAAGAAGIALDWQLALAEESTLPDTVKFRIARMDGSETGILGQESKYRVRAYARVGETAYFNLKKFEEANGLDGNASPEILAQWKQLVKDGAQKQELLLIGQDAAFAKRLSTEFRSVKGICRAIRAEASRQVRVASRLNHLGEHAPLAKSQGTRFPILQGPMTRVSDNADFAVAVAAGGAMPYMALALMRGPDVSKLLEETTGKLNGMPWGVGILGFVPKELRDEQLAEVRKFKPPYMIIAGGRPDMAKQFENEGIHVYLHVPSPELARNFLESGARRLIFEGRECGGHVGPRTSFVLWEQMTQVILDHLETVDSRRAEEYHIIFAGGAHDALSGAMLSAITAPLAERGVRVGAVIGTGYLFTSEIVSSGAITPIFQQEAVACQDTVLVESGVGHSTRCADTHFAVAFSDLKRRLNQEGKPKEEIREQLEKLNLGRLRIASKGTIRTSDPGGRAVYQQGDPDTLRREGMFMIGQVAALRGEVCTVEALHADFCSNAILLRKAADALLAEYRQGSPGSPSDIAIVGISCVFPESNDVREYWQNILNSRFAVREIPKERFDSDVYFDADRRAKDKIYSRWGGFIDDIVVDPMKFGMPPTSLPSIDPLQLVTLEMVHRALKDAGYNQRRFDRENTCCVVGTGGGVGELGLAYGIRSMLPYYVDQAGGTLADSAGLIERMDKDLPEWTEDSFAGLLLNVVAGRVANRFDFGGTNFIVDAACATSLAALRHAVTELETLSSDVAVVAASDMMQSAFTYLCFSKTQALSPTGQPRVFDETADGIVISEGVACAVLKRLDDAFLDGDKIYGVIKSVGASSDGKDKGLTAPRSIGQKRALERAYRKAGVNPNTVGLVEAHGTGTAVGDRTEAEALATFFLEKGADTRSIALGSVKSMIGHSKCAAGFAGLIKATMAMRHNVLPSTLGVTKPHSQAGSDQSSLYVNSETRPWLRRLDGAPRRAGISAFGFGGTNFHVVAEEFRPVDGSDPSEAAFRDWPSELFVWKKNSTKDLSTAIGSVLTALGQGSAPAMVDLASAIYWEHGAASGSCCLAIVAQSLDDLKTKLKSARSVVDGGKDHRDPKGIYFSAHADSPAGKIAFAFPGQGSQSVGMMNDLAVTFPEVRSVFEEADRSLGMQLGKPLSGFIFPPPVFSDEDRAANENILKQTNIAQPALGAADLAMFRLLTDLGVSPEFACGHSYGEFAALAAAGVLTVSELTRISELRGRVIIESAKNELGTMAAVEAGETQVSRLIQDVADVVIANLNGPTQTVISGTRKGIEKAVERLKSHGLKARSIPVACAFHSPLVAPAKEPLAKGLSECDLKPARFAVYSNTTAAAHSDDAAVTRQLLADHLARPVRFVDEVQAMYDAGCRVFIECGPGRVLTGLISSCLSGKPFVAIHMDQPGRSGLVQLAHALAQMAVAGIPFYATRLFEGRLTKNLPLDRLMAESLPQPMPATAWIVSNGRAISGTDFRDPAWTVLPPNPEARTSGTHILLNSGQNGSQQNIVGQPAPPASVNSVITAPSAATSANSAVTAPQTVTAVSQTVMAVPQTPTAVLQTRTVSNDMTNNATRPPSPVVPSSAAVQPSASQPLPATQLEAVMQGHHRLMNKFLETHRNIMLACLQPQAAVTTVTMSMPPTAPIASAPVVDSPVVNTPVILAAPVKAATPSAAQLPVQTVVTQVAAAAPPAVVAVPAPARIDREKIAAVLLELVSQRTGYPVESLDIDLDLEADLGVDSIKRVEIFSALQSESALPANAIEGQIEALSKLKTLRSIVDWLDARLAGTAGSATPAATSVAAPAPVEAAPAAPVSAAKNVTKEDISRVLLELVSQRTGYPVESLDIDLDLEADLGVDSIKRVEIFSALQSESALPANAIEGQIEALSKLKTLRSIVDWIDARVTVAVSSTIPVAAPATTSVPAAAPATKRITKEDVSKVLLELVSQRTGYPVESLDIDLDLEADLGVDSIKRVEIFSALQSDSSLPANAIEGQIETLSKLKTLRSIVEWIGAKVAEPAAAPVAKASAPVTNTAAAKAVASQSRPAHSPIESSVPLATRLTVEVVDAPFAQKPAKFSSFLLVTNGKNGVAAAFSARLNELGIPHCVIDHAPEAGIDLQDAASVTTLLGSLREKHGAIGGLVHLMPLAPVAPGAAQMESRTLLDLRSLYLLTKGLEKDIRSANGVVMSATRLGGTFGFGSTISDTFFPGNGTISGFVKTVAREWPEVAARTVDFSAAENQQAISRLLADELMHRDGNLEVGYSGGSRKILRSVECALKDSSSSGLKLDRNSVVMITGGARGITAATAMELAQAFQPKLVLLGRSPLPPEEAQDIAGITDPRQLRTALMDRLRTGGQRPAPAVVESMAKRVVMDREISNNLAILRSLGSEVEYRIGDVSDETGFAQVIEDVYRRYGRIDGVVHGAGLIEDKLIGDKTPESFDRVIRPKMTGANVLSRVLRPESLQFLVFFSSVSARYGNRGQCDYSAANEFLNKLAVQLNHQWPGRVVSLNWGPWRTEGGMVSDELAARFRAAGVELIEVPAGRKAFLRELLHGRKQDTEVLFGGPLTTDVKPPEHAKSGTMTGFPIAGTLIHANGSVVAHIESHPERHVFLQDHQIDGKPVLPMMAALEILAEVAASGRPGASLSAIRNLKNLHGVTYPDGAAKDFLVETSRTDSTPEGSQGMELSLKTAHSGQLHYRGRIEFGGRRPSAPPRLKLIDAKPFPLSLPDAYERWLFHGPLFAGITQIVATGANGIIGRIRTVGLEKLIRPATVGSWLVDPVVTDSSLQLVLLWARATHDQTPLPSALDAYYHFHPLHTAREIFCEIEIARAPGSPTLRSRHVFYDQDDRLLGWMDGMESTMSKALNRISDKTILAKGTGAS